MTERLTYTPVEAGELLGVSRKVIYGMLNRGELEERRAGKHRLVTARGLRKWLDGGRTKGDDIGSGNLEVEPSPPGETKTEDATGSGSTPGTRCQGAPPLTLMSALMKGEAGR